MFSLSLFFPPPSVARCQENCPLPARGSPNPDLQEPWVMEGVRVIRAPASPFRSLHSESLRKRTLSCVNINIISVNNSLIVGTNNRLFLHYTGFRAPACGLNCSVMFDYLRPLGLKPTSLLCLRDFPGKSTGEGCHFLLQGIFPT